MTSAITFTGHSDDGWESRKDTIRTWYLIEDCSLKEVTRRVNDTYGININCGQVEYQLKKWNFRKNLSVGEWDVVSLKIANRKRDGKESEVYLDNLPMNPKKVKKALSRYSKPVEDAQPASYPQTPEGIVVQTPTDTAYVAATVEHVSSTAWVVPSSVALTPLLMSSLPLTLFMNAIKAQVYGSSNHSSGNGLISSTLAEKLEVALTLGVRYESGQGESSTPFVRFIEACGWGVLVQETSHPQETISKNDLPSTFDVLKLFLFQSSNNLPGSTGAVRKYLYELSNRSECKQFLVSLMSVEGPTSEALMERLFFIAIENNDLDTIKALLECGIDPNELRDGYARDTPLLRACGMRNPEIVKALIGAGAYINAENQSGIGLVSEVLVSCHLETEERRDHGLEVVRILLNSGIRFHASECKSLLADAVRDQWLEMMDLLLNEEALRDAISDDDLDILLFEAVSEYEGDRLDVSVVNSLLHAGANACASFVFPGHDNNDDATKSFSCSMLAHAVRSGSIVLIQTLLDRGAKPDEWCLIFAVEFAEIDVVQLLLTYGAKVTLSVIKQIARLGSEDLDIVQLILGRIDDDRDLCSSGMTLYAAIAHGFQELTDRILASASSFCRGYGLTAAIEAAAVKGNIGILHALLNPTSKHQANALSSLGQSMTIAIMFGHYDVANFLLDIGADVDFKILYTGTTPLFASIIKKNVSLSQKLLTAGACVNHRHPKSRRKEYPHSYHNVTVLPAVVDWGYEPLIRAIINAGADINSTGEAQYSEMTALTVAVKKKDYSVVKILISAGADVNALRAEQTGHTALAAAIRVGDNNMVQYLLSVGAEPTELALVTAVSANSAMLQSLLKAKSARCLCFPQYFGLEALQHAIRSSNLTAISVLISNNVNPKTIFRSSATHTENCESPGCCCGIRDDSALGTAIRYDQSDDLDIIQYLLRNGADVNMVASEETYLDKSLTALLLAVDTNNYRAVKALVAAGADVNLRPNLHRVEAPVQAAAKCGSLDITKLLIECGANVNASPHNHNGATALQYAVIHGFLDIALLLLEHGANVDAPPARFDGRTALEGAAEHGRIDFVQMLLSAGARVTGPGEVQYNRARDYATKNGHMAVRRLLEKHHAQQSAGLAASVHASSFSS